MPRMIVLASLILLTGCSLGQRLLTVEVRVDDEVRFEGVRGVVDSTPVPEMWNVVPDVPLTAAAESPDGWKPDGERDCELTGNVTVRILHGSRELTRADLHSVSLSHRTEKGRAGWYLQDTSSGTRESGG